MLQMDTGKLPVYCNMDGTDLGDCGGGGWTLVMKIDGTKVNANVFKKICLNEIKSSAFSVKKEMIKNWHLGLAGFQFHFG